MGYLSSKYTPTEHRVRLELTRVYACSVVDQAKAAGMTDQQTLGTVLVTLAGSTFLVGLLIVLVGECWTSASGSKHTTVINPDMLLNVKLIHDPPQAMQIVDSVACLCAGKLKLASTVQYIPLSVIGGCE
jgi:hypothetical protein